MEVHTNNGNKQIHAKDAANKNKDNKQNANKGVIVLNRSCILFSAIDYLVHVLWPALQGAQHEEADHALQNVVEVDVVGEPVAV